MQYLTNEELLPNEEEAKKIMKLAVKYTMAFIKDVHNGKGHPMLICFGESETTMVLMEVHEDVCKVHIRGMDWITNY